MKEINADIAAAQLNFQNAIENVVDLKIKAWRELLKAVQDCSKIIPNGDDLTALAETYTSHREVLEDIEYIRNLINYEPSGAGGAGGSGER